jgi:transmembrane sensor
MFNNRLEYLFNKYFDKTATEEERMEFLQYIAEMKSDDCLIQLMEESYQANSELLYELNPKSREILLDRILVNENSFIETPKTIKVVYLAWVKYVAAMFFLTLGVTLYYNFNEKNKLTDLNIAVKHINDIQPGGNKAVLTLGNGKKILLDSANNGILAQQGSVSISKTKDGQIVYNVGGGDEEHFTNNIIKTPNGGQYQVNLPDGTKVWLNASSSIRFPTAFVGRERRVELTGEAYFEVAKNAKKPFKVNLSNNLEVNVLGTHFNINAYQNSNSINTTLLEGSVALKTGVSIQKIIPGQQAQFNTQNSKLNIDSNVDLNQIIAWKNGYFSTESISLNDLMKEVERWYGVKVVYKDNVQADFVAKIPRNINLSELVELLELTKLVKFKLNQNILTVMK